MLKALSIALGAVLVLGWLLAGAHATPILPEVYHAHAHAEFGPDPLQQDDAYSEALTGAHAYAGAEAHAYALTDVQPELWSLDPGPNYGFLELVSEGRLYMPVELAVASTSHWAEIVLWAEPFVIAYRRIPEGPAYLGYGQLTVLNVTQSTTLVDLWVSNYDPLLPPYESAFTGNIGDRIRITFDSWSQHHGPDIPTRWEVDFGAPVPEPLTVIGVLAGVVVAAIWARRY